MQNQQKISMNCHVSQIEIFGLFITQ